MANIETKKRNSKKYPLLVTYQRGKTVKRLKVPDQHKFDGFLKAHGCSIMAEYVALQWLGKNKVYPHILLSKHKKNGQPKKDEAKVTVKEVAQLLGDLVPLSFILYRSQPTLKRIKSQLDAGNIVLLEEGDPIHTVVLIRAEGKYWRITNGKCQAVSISDEAKRATKNQTYAGMVVVGSVEG